MKVQDYDKALAEQRVKPKDDVVIVWSGNDGIHKQGSKDKVHRALAPKLVDKGFAVMYEEGVDPKFPEAKPLRYQRNRQGQPHSDAMGFQPQQANTLEDKLGTGQPGNKPTVMGTQNTIVKNTGGEEGTDDLPL
jgi:hypothetical protein